MCNALIESMRRSNPDWCSVVNTSISRVAKEAGESVCDSCALQLLVPQRLQLQSSCAKD